MFGKKSETQLPDSQVFVIYDSKSRSYGNPIFSMNGPVLIRDLTNQMKDPTQQKNQLFLNAEDFSIFKVGTYDKSTGKLETHNHEHVANLHDLRAMVTVETIREAYQESPNGTSREKLKELGIVPT